MLSDTLQEAINEQIRNELYSAHLYLSMSAYCDSLNLNGFASWMRHQSQEEREHAMRLFDYVTDRGGRIRLKAIQEPAQDFQSPLEMAREFLKHEQEVSAMINDLYRQAVEEHDYATQVELHWFIQEQVEEEKSASEIVGRLELIGDNRSALLLLDRELANREEE